MHILSESRSGLNFGMAVKASDEAKRYMKQNFNNRQLKQLADIIRRQQTNSYDICLSTEKKQVQKGWSVDNNSIKPVLGEEESLVAQVAYKKFQINGWLSGPIAMIKKAQRFAEKLKCGDLPDIDKLRS